jgi:5-aminopentanamidase
MRLAIGQLPTRNAVEDNVAAAAMLVHEVRTRDAQLLLLPELFLSGYRPEAIAAAPERWAVTLDDSRLQPLVQAVRASGVAVALGAALKEPSTGALRNAMLWFGADGCVQHVYSKIHLWTSERRVFAPGDRQAVVDFHGLRMGIGICYDAGFPEFVRSYARAKVDVVLFASAFAVGQEQHRYSIYHPARALENGIYIAVANSVGAIGTSEYFGHSQVFDRQGRRVLDIASTDQFGVADLADEETEGELIDYLTDLRSTMSEPDRFEG